MCTHLHSNLRGAQFTLHTDHRSLRWHLKFRNSDGMLARWYMLLGQFSVMFEYRPGAQHANADDLSRQCGQCLRLDSPVSSSEKNAGESRIVVGVDDLLPLQLWVIRSMQTFCPNCPEKRGWRPPISTKSLLNRSRT